MKEKIIDYFTDLSDIYNQIDLFMCNIIIALLTLLLIYG